MGVSGHNSFEVYLTGGAYGTGRWALLDHDISTVIYDKDGKRLLSLAEIVPQVKDFANPAFDPARQHGWRVSGLHDDDARGVYIDPEHRRISRRICCRCRRLFICAAARHYGDISIRVWTTERLSPSFGDAITMPTKSPAQRAIAHGSISRKRCMAQKMEPARTKTRRSTPMRFTHTSLILPAALIARARSMKPPITSPSSSTRHMSLPRRLPIQTRGAYTMRVLKTDSGIPRNNTHMMQQDCTIQMLPVDQGKTWTQPQPPTSGLDLTDSVKGYQQYFLRLNASAKQLAAAGLSWTTVCQANACIIPHVCTRGRKRDQLCGWRRGNYLPPAPIASQAETHLIDGKSGSQKLRWNYPLRVAQFPLHLYAAALQASGNPPAPVEYAIDYSIDGGETWTPIVNHWAIEQRPPDPTDYWSQSFTWADARWQKRLTATPIRVRFSNDRAWRQGFPSPRKPIDV